MDGNGDGVLFRVRGPRAKLRMKEATLHGAIEVQAGGQVELSHCNSECPPHRRPHVSATHTYAQS